MYKQPHLNIGQELIIDNFAGGGGASTGIEAAFGRPVDIAINHDAQALAMHAANHPETKHYCESVWDVDPTAITNNQPVGLVWLSPDCKHFSKAKGSKPVEKKIRGLAWIALRWASKCKPRVIMLENVPEFQTWGPLITDADGNTYPDPTKKGITFESFKRQLENHGYKVEFKELIAHNFGAPTIRKRLFMVARRDGLPIVWPEITNENPAKIKDKKMQPWRTAAECIDWTIPCPSIFERKKPLAEATLKRIAKGIMRYVVESGEPFIVKTNHTAAYYDCFRGQGIGEPLQTITASPGFSIVEPILTPAMMGIGGPSGTREPSVIDKPMHAQPASGNYKAVVVPTIVPIAHYNGSNPVHDANAPMNTITAHPKGGSLALAAAYLSPYYSDKRPADARGSLPNEPVNTIPTENRHALVTAFLAKHFTGVVGSDLNDPLGTVTSVDHHSLVTASMVKFNTGAVGFGLDEPMHTITAGGKQARPGTACTMGLVTIKLVNLRNNCVGQDVREPLHTVTANAGHFAEVRAFLLSYYGSEEGNDDLTKPLRTVTSRDRFGLVTIKDQDYQIVDIGLRMLSPRELFNAQGFPADYIIGDDASQGLSLPKYAQVRMCGNSVCPPVAEALVRANFSHEQQIYGHEVA